MQKYCKRHTICRGTLQTIKLTEKKKQRDIIINVMCVVYEIIIFIAIKYLFFL